MFISEHLQMDKKPKEGNSTMTTKVWKVRPPGREQIELERMFKCNEIDYRATADSVKKRNELFKDFNSAVFSNHFRKTKAKLGLCANVEYDGPSTISEMGGFVQRERSVTPPRGSTFPLEPSRPQANHPMSHHDSPCWTWTYTNHEKQKDFVCVAVPALCGRNAKFSISEDGMQINIKYDWPEVMFKADSLFDKSVGSNGRKLTMNHPKVHAFVSRLIESGVTEKSTLQASVTVDLPTQVQRENNSWTMEKVEVANTKMILLEFSAYQKPLFINDADTSLDF